MTETAREWALRTLSPAELALVSEAHQPRERVFGKLVSFYGPDTIEAWEQAREMVRCPPQPIPGLPGAYFL